jgi:hypothetical protein
MGQAAIRKKNGTLTKFKTTKVTKKSGLPHYLRHPELDCTPRVQ